MDEVVSLARMARLLGVAQSWLRERANSGEVPSLKAGSRFLFNPNAVATALAQSASQSKGDAHAKAE